MANRITQVNMTEVFIDQIFKQRAQLEKSREQVATGLKVIEAGDDPGRSGTISQMQNTIFRLEKHKERMELVTNSLSTQEAVVDSAVNVLIRARELAEQGANGATSTQGRELIGEEVMQLRDELVALANTKYQGRYLYHGAADDTAPFAASAIGYTNPAGTGPLTERYVFVIADGGSTTRDVQISDSVTIQINTSGEDLFENAVGAMERLGRALKGYRSTLNANGLPDGGGTAYNLPADIPAQTADILAAMDDLNSAVVSDLGPERSSIAARVNRLEQARSTMEVMITNTESVRSNLQDADPFEAISNISNLETGLQALLALGGRINSLSLLDFI